jgi:hypothetical protein
MDEGVEAGVQLSEKAKSAVIDSEIPKDFQALVLEVVSKFGFEWHIELAACEERLGTGVGNFGIDLLDELDKNPSPELQESINSLMAVIEEYAAKFGPSPVDPLEGFTDLIEQIEFIDWEDEYGSDIYFKQEILRIWYDDRIDYLRSLKKFKLAKAREKALSEVESINIGGEELTCRSCGIFFYDHFEKHFRISKLYCSITCEENAVLQCIQCGIEFKVGKGTGWLRRLKLSGFCSELCHEDFKSDKSADQRYVYGMKKRAIEFEVAFDDSITRRDVFKKGKGVCAICKLATHFESREEFSPNLATVDHIIPWTKGGSHTWENVQLCCLRCNMSKGNR